MGFGALPYDIHSDYVALMSSRVAPGGFIFMEVNERTDRDENDRSAGPPFHISKEYLLSMYSDFELLEVVENPFGRLAEESKVLNAKLTHMAYLLKKKF